METATKPNTTLEEFVEQFQQMKENRNIYNLNEGLILYSIKTKIENTNPKIQINLRGGNYRSFHLSLNYNEEEELKDINSMFYRKTETPYLEDESGIERLMKSISERYEVLENIDLTITNPLADNKYGAYEKAITKNKKALFNILKERQGYIKINVELSEMLVGDLQEHIKEEDEKYLLSELPKRLIEFDTL